VRNALSAAVLLLALVPALGSSAEDVLIYDEHHLGPQSDLVDACELTGDYTCTAAASEGDFATQAGGGAFDIIMVDLLYGWFTDPSAETAMFDFIDAGGFAVLHLTGLENEASAAASLGATVTQVHGGVLPVYGGDMMFNNEAGGGYSVPNPMSGGSNVAGMDQELESDTTYDPSANAMFHYENVITGAPAVVTSHLDTVVLLGFSPDETGRNDQDGDAVVDMHEFLSNCLDFVVACSEEDADGDGWTQCDGDCDDSDDDVSPDALEVPGDGQDSNCDGNDGDDADGDGHGSPDSGGDDCDDEDDAVHPGADELANGEDEDCDGELDEGTELSDDDGDGYCEGLDLDGDGADDCSDGSTPGDCDDEEDDISPDAIESCYDTVDNNCDGLIDGDDEEACPGVGDDDDDDDSTPPGGQKTVGGCNCILPGLPAAGGALAPLLLLATVAAARRGSRRR
jgi:hypothetical protein